MRLLRTVSRRFTPAIWLLTSGRLLDMTTLWMAIPFMSLLVKRAGASYGMIGFVLALNPIAQLVGNLVGGQWSDRQGRRPVILTAMSLRVVVLIGFALATAVWQFALFSFCNGLVNALFNPAYTAALADQTPPERRPEVFALSRVMSNLGVGLGPLLGAALGIGAQRLIFSLAAFSSFAVALAFWFRLPETGRRNVPQHGIGGWQGMAESWRTIFTDRALLTFIAAGMLAQMAYSQINSSFPLHLSSFMASYERVYGLVWTLNGALVVILQLPLTFTFRRIPMAVASITGCAVYAVGYTLFGLATTAATVHAAAMVWTVGEVILSVPNTTFATDIAPAPLRARYVGAASLEKALGGIVGPLLGTWALRRAGGQSVLFGAAITVVVAGFLFVAAERERTRRMGTGLAA